MGRGRQIVLQRAGSDSTRGDLASMGTPREVLGTLARFNTAPDGSGPRAGMEVLWGPGMVLEFPAGTPAVRQIMVSLTEEDMAFPVLMRLCRELGWEMVDLESGRRFG